MIGTWLKHKVLQTFPWRRHCPLLWFLSPDPPWWLQRGVSPDGRRRRRETGGGGASSIHTLNTFTWSLVGGLPWQPEPWTSVRNQVSATKRQTTLWGRSIIVQFLLYCHLLDWKPKQTTVWWKFFIQKMQSDVSVQAASRSFCVSSVFISLFVALKDEDLAFI